MSGKEACSIGNACMWHWVGESSSLSFRLSCHPSSRHAWSSLAWLQFGSLHKALGDFLPRPPALPTTVKNLLFLEIKKLALQTTHEYPHARQTGLVLPASVPSQSLLLLFPKPDSWGAIFMDLSSVLFNQLECWVHTDFLARALVSVNSLKAGTVILISILWDIHRHRQSDAYSWWRGGRENQQVQ